MVHVINAISELGVYGYIRGDDPTTEAEFLERFVPLNGSQVPAWQTVLDKISELELAELPEVKLKAKSEISDVLDDTISSIIGIVPAAEKVSWPVKEEAAKAYISGTPTPEQSMMIQEEASLTGEALIDLANNIISKATAYKKLAGQISGIRRSLYISIDNATDEATVKTITETGKNQINSMALSLSNAP